MSSAVICLGGLAFIEINKLVPLDRVSVGIRRACFVPTACVRGRSACVVLLSNTLPVNRVILRHTHSLHSFCQQAEISETSVARRRRSEIEGEGRREEGEGPTFVCLRLACLVSMGYRGRDAETIHHP